LLSYIEAIHGHHCLPAGRDWLAQASQQTWAAEAAGGLPPRLLHAVVAALAADPATFGPQLQRLAADCPALHSADLEPSLLALLPQAAIDQEQSKQRITEAAAHAAAIAVEAMAGNGLNGATPDSSLALLLEQLGYSATGSEAAARKVVAAAGVLSPRSVAAALGLMARTREGLTSQSNDAASALGGLSLDDSQTSGWQPQVLVEAIKAAAPGLDWSAVAEALDQVICQLHLPVCDGTLVLL
jgi:hypothetical protein